MMNTENKTTLDTTTKTTSTMNTISSATSITKKMSTAKNKSFTINDVTVKPGEKRIIGLPVAKLYTHGDQSIPVHIICGKLAGPTLFISSAIHGDELNGVEIVRRFLKTRALDRLHGTLIVIPVVNIFGIIQHSRYLPDRRDLNRCFPGSRRGSLAARLAHIVVKEIVSKSDYGIDLHTGALHRSNLPQIRANLKDEETLDLAKSFRVPVLVNADLRDGSLRQVADEYGVKVLLYEAGEALRFDELSIRAGVRGILSVMRHLKMLRSSKSKTPQKAKELFVTDETSWARASESGILRSIAGLGSRVKKGELLGVISDPSDLFDQTEYEIRSDYNGLIIGKSNIPLVNEGDAIFHIARFKDNKQAAEMVEAFQATGEESPNPVFDDHELG
jgi:predicted deacylase